MRLFIPRPRAQAAALVAQLRALGIEMRADAAEVGRRLSALVHRPTWLAVQAERAVSRALGGSCTVPLAAHARWDGEWLCLDAALGDAQQLTRPLLRHACRACATSDAEADALGREAAAALRALGADAYLAAAG